MSLKNLLLWRQILLAQQAEPRIDRTYSFGLTAINLTLTIFPCIWASFSSEKVGENFLPGQLAISSNSFGPRIWRAITLSWPHPIS